MPENHLKEQVRTAIEVQQQEIADHIARMNSRLNALELIKSRIDLGEVDGQTLEIVRGLLK